MTYEDLLEQTIAVVNKELFIESYNPTNQGEDYNDGSDAKCSIARKHGKNNLIVDASVTGSTTKKCLLRVLVNSSGIPISRVEELIWFNDQPVASLSNLSHYLLVKMARDSGVKVLMTGQGADELLSGYRKYLIFYLQYLIRNRKFSRAYNILSQFYKNDTILSQFNLSEAKRYLKFFS